MVLTKRHRRRFHHPHHWRLLLLSDIWHKVWTLSISFEMWKSHTNQPPTTTIAASAAAAIHYIRSRYIKTTQTLAKHTDRESFDRNINILIYNLYKCVWVYCVYNITRRYVWETNQTNQTRKRTKMTRYQSHSICILHTIIYTCVCTHICFAVVTKCHFKYYYYLIKTE